MIGARLIIYALYYADDVIVWSKMLKVHVEQ